MVVVQVWRSLRRTTSVPSLEGPGAPAPDRARPVAATAPVSHSRRFIHRPPLLIVHRPPLLSSPTSGGGNADACRATRLSLFLRLREGVTELHHPAPLDVDPRHAAADPAQHLVG